jgi:hypothetical protein
MRKLDFAVFVSLVAGFLFLALGLAASASSRVYVASESVRVYKSNYLFQETVSLANAGPDLVWCRASWPAGEAEGRVIAPNHTEVWRNFAGSLFCMSPGLAEVVVESRNFQEPKLAPWAKR